MSYTTSIFTVNKMSHLKGQKILGSKENMWYDTNMSKYPCIYVINKQNSLHSISSSNCIRKQAHTYLKWVSNTMEHE